VLSAFLDSGFRDSGFPDSRYAPGFGFRYDCSGFRGFDSRFGSGDFGSDSRDFDFPDSSDSLP